MNGLVNSKCDSSEFTDIICNHDICFLYKSWAKISSNVALNGYISHNYYRKFQHRNARRASGGMVVYYRESLKDGIEVVKNHHDTIIWLKLKHDFFGLKEDIYLCGCYIWGEDSPAYNVVNVDLFDLMSKTYQYLKVLEMSCWLVTLIVELEINLILLYMTG